MSHHKNPLGLGLRYAQIGGLTIAVLGLVTNLGFLEWTGLVVIVTTGLWSIGGSIAAVVSINRRRRAAKKHNHT
jgi:hypothetical protein